MRSPNPFAAALAPILAALLLTGPLAAQVPDTLAGPAADTLTADTVLVITGTGGATERDVELPELDEPTTPGGAFLRAVLLPGWGHASIGSHQRGAFYFAAEATTGLLLARTLHRLSLAKDARALEEARLTAALEARSAPLDSIPVLLEQDPAVDDARDLVEARQQQVEDWIALGAFLLFLSGADAFVSAHLRDFPAPLETDARLVPGPEGLGASFGISVGVGP